MTQPQFDPSIKQKVQDIIDLSKETLGSNLGMEFISAAPDKLVARMPVDKRTKQPFGLLHGGASVALAESLASTGAWLNVDEKKYFVVGQEINANHIRSLDSGYVIGTSVPLHIGRSSQVWETKIHAEDTGKLICVSRCTLAVVERKP